MSHYRKDNHNKNRKDLFYFKMIKNYFKTFFKHLFYVFIFIFLMKYDYFFNIFLKHWINTI